MRSSSQLCLCILLAALPTVPIEPLLHLVQAAEIKEQVLSSNGANANGAAVQGIVSDLAAEPDWGEDETLERKVSVIEQCIALGGEKRLRLLITVSVGGKQLRSSVCAANTTFL